MPVIGPNSCCSLSLVSPYGSRLEQGEEMAFLLSESEEGVGSEFIFILIYSPCSSFKEEKLNPYLGESTLHFPLDIPELFQGML